jgi:glycogen debranching enzyme
MLKPPPDHVVDDINEPSAFYIQATAPSSRPRHTLKHGNTFVVCDSHGDIGMSPGSADGVYNHDTRFLSRMALLVGGAEPLLLGSTVRDDNVSLSVDLTNPDFYADGRITLQRDTVHIVRNIFVWENVVYQRVHLANYGAAEASLAVTVRFACDFTDLFEVRGSPRKARGTTAPAEVRADRITARYLGLDNQERAASLVFDPAPDALDAAAATYAMTLPPGGERTFVLGLECEGQEVPHPSAFIESFIAATRHQRVLIGSNVEVESSNQLFDEMMRRAVVDLCMLTTDTPQGPYPYAGIPWFSTTFGRDGLITALQMLWINPAVARGVLRRLAYFQADARDPLSDAEPGRILHEMRGGEMAALREVPFALYYGASDSTPLFLVLLGRYLQRTGDLETVEELWPHAERALAWMAEYGDRDRDGFLEYRRETEEGLQNQCWKDSFDSIFHADGRIPEGPIATAEIQGYAFAAYEMSALCAARLGRAAQAAELGRKAIDLQNRFEAAFWCEDIGTYAIALDGQKQPCRIRSSNAGQVLWTGIASPERAKRVADGLVSADFFSGWGVRTVAQGEVRYNPMAYHNGSIWPHDNSLIAAGMARYGHMDQAEKVFRGLFEATAYMPLRRMPELFCGFRRREGAGPISYPVACAPQAWAAATPFLLLQACLGLEFDPALRAIRFRKPRLPAFLDEVTLRRLELGGAQVDVTLRRVDTHVAISVLRNEGGLTVLLEA